MVSLLLSRSSPSLTDVEKLAQSSFEETEALETDLARLTAELKQLQVQEPPLKLLNADFLHLTGDKTKFIHYLDQLRQKQEKLQQGIERMKLANVESGRSPREMIIDFQNE
jgi:SMC interacting uncharacterized protein involved in chromosome segregation